MNENKEIRIDFAPTNVNYNTVFGDTFTQIGNHTSLLKACCDYNQNLNLLSLKEKRFCRSAFTKHFGICNKPTKTDIRRKDAKVFSIYSGLLSLIGLGEVSILNDRIGIVERQRYLTTHVALSSDKYDVLVIGAINGPSNLINIGNTNLSTVSKHITIFVAREKFWKNNKYMSYNYAPTVRAKVMKELKMLQTEYGIYIEQMDDDKIDMFIQKGTPLPTNSVMDIMNIEKRVLNNVFTNLRTNIQVAR